MSTRSRLATAILVVAALSLISGRSWAVYWGLGPSKDDWGMKYDVEVNPAADGKLTVVFTIADEGRLKPLHSIELIALSKQADGQGRRSYDVKAPIKLETTPDGRRAGQVQIPREFADQAKFRILTLTVDGRRQTGGAASYDIPLKKHLNNAPGAASPSTATPPGSNVTK